MTQTQACRSMVLGLMQRTNQVATPAGAHQQQHHKQHGMRSQWRSDGPSERNRGTDRGFVHLNRITSKKLLVYQMTSSPPSRRARGQIRGKRERRQGRMSEVHDQKQKDTAAGNLETGDDGELEAMRCGRWYFG